MSDENSSLTDQGATPATEPTPVDLGKMTAAELERFAETGEVPGSTKPAEPSPPTDATQTAKPTDQPPPAPASGDKGSWIEVQVGDRTLKFKSQAELIKSLQNSQQLVTRQKETIDRYNAERGQQGQRRSEPENVQSAISALQEQIRQLQAGSQQIARGKQPTNPATIDALTRNAQSAQPQDPASAVTARLTALETELRETRDQFRQATDELNQEREITRRQKTVNTVYRDVEGLQQKHPELSTSVPLEQLDGIVSKYGLADAEAMMTPADYAAYKTILGVLAVQYETDENGELVLSQKRLKSPDMAYAAYQADNGNAANALAAAGQRGREQYEKALGNAAAATQTLPASAPAQAGVELGPAELSALLKLSPHEINADPKLRAQFKQAMKQLQIEDD